jgi:hypothetical protein
MRIPIPGRQKISKAGQMWIGRCGMFCNILGGVVACPEERTSQGPEIQLPLRTQFCYTSRSKVLLLREPARRFRID